MLADPFAAARARLVVALDFDSPAEALSLARRLVGVVGWVKVATRLHGRGGAALLQELTGLGHRLFLDLKFHDIPDQVEGACQTGAAAGAELMTVHAAGGAAMLAAAVRGAQAGAREAGRPTDAARILAVTVLTSLDGADLRAIGVQRPVEEQVLGLARLAVDAGCGGAVCSPLELDRLRAELPPSFGLLTPGIRPQGAAADDQKRVLTPGQAVRRGADWLVVGRPIRRAPDPVAAAQAIVEQMAAALAPNGG